MPNETEHKNNEGAGGDQGAGAGAGAGNGSGEGAGKEGAGAGQGQGAGQGNGGEETITVKKSEWDKKNQDLDTYRTRATAKAADERNLDAGGQGGEGAGKGGEGAGAGAGSGQIDETKIAKAAEAAAHKTMRAAADRVAKRTFLKNHPEYLDDAQWASMIANLTFKGDEATAEEVLDRMEAAVVEHKRSTGQLDDYLKSEREKGRQQGRTERDLEHGRDAGGAGDRGGSGQGAPKITPEAEGMARRMHTDPAKVAAVDPSKDNVIDVIAKPAKK